jgi:hypothetical protein
MHGKTFSMGAIYAFNIKQLIEHYQLSTYIETGTGAGVSLQHALLYPFHKFFSVEMDFHLYEQAYTTYNANNVSIKLGKSKDLLPEILGDPGIKGNILFFLDAHFPEADFGSSLDTDRYAKSIQTYAEDALPLKKELEAIKKFRADKPDVIIIDDLRIYEDNNYEDGNWLERPKYSIGGRDFVTDIFERTHNIEVVLKHQGYLLITPKKGN